MSPIFSYFVAEEGSVPPERQDYDSSNLLDIAGKLLTTFFLMALCLSLVCLGYIKALQ
jgi:hypothetical protein